MPKRMNARLVAVLLLLVAAGCQSRLNETKSLKLDVGKDWTFPIDAPKYDQTVSVTVTADVPIDVYVYLEKNQDAADRDITLGKANSDKVLAGKTAVQNETLECRIPAKEKAVVMVRSTKPGTATLKIVGK